MSATDFDDELDLPKMSPLKVVMTEDLTSYSIEALKIRLEALKAAQIRTEKAIEDKGDAKKSAENFFK